MTIVQIIAALGTILLFASRTFLPAFLIALFLAYPALFPGVENVSPVPEDVFLTQTWMLVVLGILSVLEIWADKNSDIRSFMNDAVTYLKPISYLIIGLGLIDNSSVKILKEVQWAGFDPMVIIYLFGMLAVHWLATLRRDFINFLGDIDEDDNLFIGRIISWSEDSLVIFGFFLLIWSGILMVVVYTLLVGFFIYMRKRHEKKLESQKTKCANCGEKNLPFAVKCYYCKKPQAQVYAIGLLGQKKDRLISDVQKHQINLISHRKCPDCGNKLKSKKIFQNCDYCGTQIFSSPSVKDYTRSLDHKFYKIAGFSFLLGFIPVVGFVVSAVLANIYLVSPYRKFIPVKSSIMTRIFIKLLTFVLFIFGAVLGFIVAPLYCAMRYYGWKGKFKTRIRSARKEIIVDPE